MCLCGLSSSVPSLVRLPTALSFLRLCCFFCCCCCCSSTSSPVFRRLVYRSGPAVVCRDQRGHHSVQADHSRRGRVLEFPGGARHSGSALHLARLLQEEAGVEPRRPRHPRLLLHPLGSGTCSRLAGCSASVSCSADGRRISGLLRDWPVSNDQRLQGWVVLDVKSGRRCLLVCSGSLPKVFFFLI